MTTGHSKARISILLITLLLCGLVFVGGAAAGPKVKLNVSVMVGVYGERAKALEKQFERENSDIDVVLEETGYTDIFQKQILDATSGRAKFDVYTVCNHELGTYAAPGHIIPLTEFLNDSSLVSPDLQLDDYYDAYLKGCTQYNGVTYSMPYQFWVMAFYYRKDLWSDKNLQAEFRKKYGYDLRVPKNYDEFKDMAAFFTRDRDGDGKLDLYGFGMDGMRGTGGSNTYQFLPFLWAWGSDVFDKNMKPAFNSPEGVKALEYYASLVAFSPPDWVQNMCDMNTTLFQQDLLAMSIHDSDQFGYINDVNTSKAQVVGNVALAPAPVGPAGKPVVMLAGWTMAINADSKHKKEAFRYIQWMASKGRAAVQAGFGEPPCRKSWLEDPENQKAHPEYRAMAASLPYAKTVPNMPEFSKVFDILGIAVQQACLREKTPKEALDWAASEVYKVMDEAGYYRK